MTVRDAILSASARIARRDAETLLLHVCGHSRAWLLAHPDDCLTWQQLAAFQRSVERRAAREPVQYITGHQEFFGLDLHVTPAVLIPRPETELLVETVLAWCRDRPPASPPLPLRLVDVGTGSGAIALALAANLPGAICIALDVSPSALAVARANAARIGLDGRLTFVESDLLGGLGQTAAAAFDVVVSNPPYVPRRDAPEMHPEVRDYEPHTALFAGPDGLDVYRRLIPQTLAALRPCGLLAMEIGFGQSNPVATLLQGWQNVRFLDDLAGIPRVAVAERP